MPWAKGQSGNPAGRQRSAAALTQIARKHCREALKLLVRYMNDETQDEKVRIQAASMILDRGLGKAAQGVTAQALTDEELVQELKLRREARDAEQRRAGSGNGTADQH